MSSIAKRYDLYLTRSGLDGRRLIMETTDWVAYAELGTKAILHCSTGEWEQWVAHNGARLVSDPDRTKEKVTADKPKVKEPKVAVEPVPTLMQEELEAKVLQKAAPDRPLSHD
jgi:hypothetical protein